MAGISPTRAGGMAEALPLELVTSRVRRELWHERAAGLPLKTAYAAVARRLGVSPRRVRAFHHGEVAADEVTAAELLAADAAWRREIETLEARLSALEGALQDEVAGAAGGMAPRGLDAARQAMRGPGRGVAGAPGALARLVR